MVLKHLRRFKVAEASMEPALFAGQGVLAVASRTAKPGQIRVFRHPRRPHMWLIKRVHEVRDDGSMVMHSDNKLTASADSRTFGSVPIAGSYRVVFRTPAPQDRSQANV